MSYNVPIRIFVRVPRQMLCVLSGPAVQENDICLITHEEIKSLHHVVRGSDGRWYDAFALQHWLRFPRPKFVVPGCPIDHVFLTPCLLHYFERAWHFMLVCCARVAQEAQVTHASIAERPKRALFLQIIDYHRAAKQSGPGFCGKRGIKRSAASAFAPVRAKKKPRSR